MLSGTLYFGFGLSFVAVLGVVLLWDVTVMNASVFIVFFAFCAGIVGDLMMVVLFPYAMAFANVEVNAVNRHQRARSDLQHAGDRAGGRQRRRAAAVRVRGLTC